jgi:FKBP-type peptidyl-prolyl cis-trans isomerase SlyD
MTEPIMVQNGVKVSMKYVLTVDGELVDESREGDPLTFVQGHGEIIRGLETEILDMMVGETKEVVVEPAKGYGLVIPQYIISAPRDRLPPNIPQQVGAMFHLPAPNGQTVPARILEFTNDAVRLDLNHPLAGKTLHFKVTIVALSS